MRPNRIGAWPMALNAIENTIQSAVIRMDDDLDSTGALNANRTPIDEIELFPGVTGINDTILCRTMYYADSDRTELTDSLPRFSVGGFLNASGVRSGTGEPSPLYMRVVGHAKVKLNGTTSSCWLQPVIGIKKNNDPVTLGSGSSDKDSRALSVATVIPLIQQANWRLGGAGIHNSYVDQTLMLGSTFSRFGGVGFDSSTIFGVGWSVVNPDRDSGASLGLEGYMEFFMSAWLYTADMDMYDPNRS